MPLAQPWMSLYPSHIPAQVDFSELKPIPETLDRSFERYGSRPALTCMGTTVTYSELGKLANRFASFLSTTLKLKKGDRIAIMLPNVIQFAVAELGALKAGLVCVNTNPLYTPREMKHQFADSGCKAIVILDLFLDKLEEIIADVSIDHVISTNIADQLPLWKEAPLKAAQKLKGMIPKTKLTVYPFKKALAMGQASSLDCIEHDIHDMAILQYTGGTTGVSKGAVLTHANIMANARQIQLIAKGQFLEGEETVLTALPLYHIFALTVNFVAFLTLGEHMILIPKPIPIQNTVKAFEKYPISIVTGVNTLFNAINHASSFKKRPPKTVKFAIAGGMALHPKVSEDFQNLTGTPILEGYGLTEASPVTHLNPILGRNPVGSMGIPLPGTLAKVVQDDGTECSIGEVGELLVKGPQVMKGYWNKTEETNKVLRDGWLWTGDMAKMDERGYFYIVDRKKDVIIVSGFNVYPNEVEAVLSSHPKVLEVAVVGVADANSGEAVKAFIVKKDETLTVEELKLFSRAQLTGYKVPRHYEFRDQLPKTNVGKILRKELRDKTPS